MKIRLPAIALLALAAAALGQTTAPAAPQKLPVPDAAALKNSLKLVNDVYKDDLAKAKTADQKVALAKAMLSTAAAEKQAAGKYALFTTAVDLADSAGDLETATAAIGQIDAFFEVDALKLRADAAATAARAAHTPDQCKKILPLAEGTIDAAVNADRYDLALVVGDDLLFACRSANDSPSVKELAGRIQDIHEAQSAFEGIKGPLMILNLKPADPEANLTVGKFRCFIKGDWDGGLPMLALCADDALKSLAKADQAATATADDQAKLADGWWDQAEKATGLTQRRIRQRAVKWYQAALPNLTGLSKLRVQKRLDSLDPAAASQPAHKIVDLLALVDPKKDMVAGGWQIKDKTLKSDDGAGSRIEIPYHPGTEYDLHLEFARETGDDSVNVILAAAGKHFMWTLGGWKNTIVGFDEINHVRANQNPKNISAKAVLENGRKYDVVIKIRKTGVEAAVNGKMVSQWKTDYSDMGIPDNWNLRDAAALGLATNKSPTTFYKIEVTEITGAGTLTHK